MNREQAELLLAAYLFDELDPADRARLEQYLQTDPSLREQLADMRLAAKLLDRAVNGQPQPVLSEQRRRALLDLAGTLRHRRTGRALTGRLGRIVRAPVGRPVLLAALLLLSVGVLLTALLPSLSVNKRAAHLVATMPADNAAADAGYAAATARAPKVQLERQDARRQNPAGGGVQADKKNADGQSLSDTGLPALPGAATKTTEDFYHYADAETKTAPTALTPMDKSVAPTGHDRPVNALSASGEKLVPREIELPNPVFAGTPPAMKGKLVNIADQPDSDELAKAPVAGTGPMVPDTEASSQAYRKYAQQQKAEALPAQDFDPAATTAGQRELTAGRQAETRLGEALRSRSAAPAEPDVAANDDADTTVYGTVPVTAEPMLKDRSEVSAGKVQRLTGFISKEILEGRGQVVVVDERNGQASRPEGDGTLDWFESAVENSETERGLSAALRADGKGGPGTGQVRRGGLANADKDELTRHVLKIQDGLAGKPKPFDRTATTGQKGRQDPASQVDKQNDLAKGPTGSTGIGALGGQAGPPGPVPAPTATPSARRAAPAAPVEQSREESERPLPPASRFRLVPVNPWVLAEQDRFSTFALDVDTASYALCRRYLASGYLPPRGAVRMEEFINAFDYNYPQQGQGVFNVYVEAGPSPFAPSGQSLVLMKVGVQGKVVGRAERKAAHLVFVVDTSGSMARSDRLPLVQYALKQLVGQLGPADRVSLVTYRDRARLLLEAEPATHRDKIGQAIDRLQAGQATNLLAGLKAGFALARREFVAGRINRVILCTDGAANVGRTDARSILRQVAADRVQGITLTVAGFGQVGYNDQLLETLAKQGDGNYLYIDSASQARRLFVEQLSSTLQIIARDAKIQVEFNPLRVRRYRLIGYEKRAIADQQFRDDTVDAGEVGSGRSATALYELELQEPADRTDADQPLGTVYVRWREVDGPRVQELAYRIDGQVVRAMTVDENPRFYLAACAARFAELLRDSEHARGGRYEQVQAVLEQVCQALPLDQQARQLLELVRRARHLPRIPGG